MNNKITIIQISENNKIWKNTQHYNHLSQRKQQYPEKHTTKLQSPRLAKTTISAKTHNKIIIIQFSENSKIWKNAQQNYNHLGQQKQQYPEKRTTKLQSSRLAKTTISGKTHNKITITQVSESNKIHKNAQQNYNHLGQRKQQNLEKHTTTRQN